MTTTDLPPIPDGVDVADTIRYVNDHARARSSGTISGHGRNS